MSTADPVRQDVERLAEAAEWLQRLQEEDDAGTVEQWLEWCARDPANQRAFDGIAAAWHATATVQEAPPRRGFSWLAMAAGIAALAVALTLAGWLTFRPAEAEAVRLVKSLQGEILRTGLPDGTIMELGGQSEAQVAYARQWRRVHLHQGQMYVTVAHDRGRPFVVHAGELEVTALGTAFDVRRQAASTAVTVTEGSVEVRLNDAGQGADLRPAVIRLAAGEQLLHEHGGGLSSPRRVDVALSTSWRSGVLGFVDEPLAQVIATLNRYAAREILIGDREVAGLTFTGVAHPDRIDRWLEALPDALPVTLLELPDGRFMVLSRARPARSFAGAP